MRLVILDKNNNVVVEVQPDKFKELMLKYAKELGSVEKAFDFIASELKKRTLVI